MYNNTSCSQTPRLRSSPGLQHLTLVGQQRLGISTPLGKPHSPPVLTISLPNSKHFLRALPLLTMHSPRLNISNKEGEPGMSMSQNLNYFWDNSDLPRMPTGRNAISFVG